jgi:hypothetical protein
MIIGKGKPNSSEGNLPHYLFAHHIPHKVSGIELGPPNVSGPITATSVNLVAASLWADVFCIMLSFDYHYASEIEHREIILTNTLGTSAGRIPSALLSFLA